MLNLRISECTGTEARVLISVLAILQKDHDLMADEVVSDLNYVMDMLEEYVEEDGIALSENNQEFMERFNPKLKEAE